jgi:hypothetical protein
MADSRISDLTAASAAAGANELEINEAGTSKKITGTQLKDFINNAPVFAAGSASANSWPKMTPGTLLTTAEDGALEMDTTNLYGCTDAGNRGYIPIRHFIRANATRTLPNDTNENAIFNSPANGRITLEAGTYFFEGIIRVSSMSATSGNALLDILGAGTATIGAWLWWYSGIDSTSPETAAAHQAAFRVTQDSQAAPMVTAGTGTAMALIIQGTFEVTSGGTVIPSIDLQTAAAAVISIGSYIVFERIGTENVVSVGQWD